MTALELARCYGVNVRFADLGDWGDAELRSEYDPTTPEIRLNVRYAAALSPAELGEFVALAVGHELYHHREAIAEMPVLRDRRAREAAADRLRSRTGARVVVSLLVAGIDGGQSSTVALIADETRAHRRARRGRAGGRDRRRPGIDAPTRRDARRARRCSCRGRHRSGCDVRGDRRRHQRL